MRRLNKHFCPGVLIATLALFPAACKHRPKPPDEDSKPKATAADEPIPVPKVIDVDPNTLAPDKKKSYDKGYNQGLKMANDYRKGAAKGGEPSAEKMAQFVQDWLQERDFAIQVALQKAGSAGADDNRVLEACGRKAGFKEGLAKQGITPK